MSPIRLTKYHFVDLERVELLSICWIMKVYIIFFRINKHGYIHLTSDQELACHLGWQADIIHVAFDGGSREVHSDLFTDVIGRPGLCTTHCTTRLRIPVPHNVSQGPYGPTFQLIKRIHYILYTSQFLFDWANLICKYSFSYLQNHRFNIQQKHTILYIQTKANFYWLYIFIIIFLGRSINESAKKLIYTEITINTLN